ncbi:MAG: protein phosphatase 2C domain-containing protein [Cyanobacteria bacterium J06639_1]
MMRFAGHTDKGMVRSTNQDSFYCDPEGYFFVVADGMGGHAAGATASELAVNAIQAKLRNARNKLPAPQLLSIAIQEANQAILVDQQLHPEHADMGTTIVVAHMDNDGKCWSAHIGDSRLYRLRGTDIEQITPDHTLIARAVRRGEITLAESRFHPHRHILERCLGRPESGLPEVHSIELKVGDRLLLCSDGLTEELSDTQIVEGCQQASVLEEIPFLLIRDALASGGRDNVTVVVTEYLG